MPAGDKPKGLGSTDDDINLSGDIKEWDIADKKPDEIK